MKMKQISAATIKEAMGLARQMLGEDAVLMDSKKSAQGVVVTFAIDTPDEPLWDDEELGLPAAPTPAAAPEIPRPATARVEANHPAIELLRHSIAYHAIPDILAQKLLYALDHTRLSPGAVLDVAEGALTQALTNTIRFTPLDLNGPPPLRALMLVGPHGAGKTSTIAKIATALAIRKQPVLLISTDNERLGGAESLQTLASLLKCEFAMAESRAGLKTLLAKHLGRAWVLIDSTGANIYEFKQLKALGEFASLQSIEPVLTCAAGMDAAEAQEMAGVFNFLDLERMIVTRLDAVRRLGSVFATLSGGSYALSHYTNSAIPTDAAAPLSAKTLAHLMLRHVRERMNHG